MAINSARNYIEAIEHEVIFLMDISTINRAIYSALYKDLPDIERGYNTQTIKGRPTEHDISVYIFPQMWSSTALGYDNMIAGRGFTNAYTIIVHETKYSNNRCVYFGGDRLAYKIGPEEFTDAGLNFFENDMVAYRMASCREYQKRYTKL